MTEIAIRVEHLGKQYRIGGQQRSRRNFQEAVVDAVSAPLRWMRSGQRPPETFWALDNVSLDIQDGEAVGIIGRNGAGKSTLLKILSRITRPTRGRVVLYGRVGSLLEVGTGFHSELTGRENIFLSGAIMGMGRREITRKFDEIVDFAGIERFLDTPVKFYSSGMYVRLAFAVAAHLEPEILLVDEVLAVGDAEFQKKCLGKMGDVAQQGRTVLFVSHNLSAINRLCTRALLLDAGKLVRDGTAGAVTGAYLHGGDEFQRGQQWSVETAPASEELRLLSVKLLRNGVESPPVVEVGDSLTLQIEYYVRKPGVRFRCGAQLFSMGVCAVASVEPTETLYDSVGRYFSRVTIPPNLLAENEYTVSVGIFTSSGVKTHLVKVRHILSFQVVDPMTKPSARGDYAEDFLSVLRPILDWKISHVPETR